MVFFNHDEDFRKRDVSILVCIEHHPHHFCVCARVVVVAAHVVQCVPEREEFIKVEFTVFVGVFIHEHVGDHSSGCVVHWVFAVYITRVVHGVQVFIDRDVTAHVGIEHVKHHLVVIISAECEGIRVNTHIIFVVEVEGDVVHSIFIAAVRACPILEIPVFVPCVGFVDEFISFTIMNENPNIVNFIEVIVNFNPHNAIFEVCICTGNQSIPLEEHLGKFVNFKHAVVGIFCVAHSIIVACIELCNIISNVCLFFSG